MKILKFGGTSVGSAKRMREVLEIAKAESDTPIVVLSAMAGTTNALVDINLAAKLKNEEERVKLIHTLHSSYIQSADLLFSASNCRATVQSYLDTIFIKIKDLTHRKTFSEAAALEVLAQGELISTYLFHQLCLSEGQSSLLLNALDFVRLDHKDEPDLELTQSLLLPLMEDQRWASIIITQGYICRDHNGRIDNLRRGGSDYTATIIGGVLEADEIQIWTDIDGVRNNDPRFIEDTFPIRKMSYREAAELAYFGAKILHPTCVLPAEKAGVPLRLKYTMRPDAPGTLISNEGSGRPITAIAAKDGITAIKIYSHRMLMAYGFLRRVFQAFEDYETPVDMITTSEVAVSLTIDDDTNLAAITRFLSQFGEVEAKSGYSIICIVGNELYEDSQYLQVIFEALKNIPLRMVSMGGSRYNISILLKTEYKIKALGLLNTLFEMVDA